MRGPIYPPAGALGWRKSQVRSFQQISFGSFRLDTRNELLLHASLGEIPLRPKTFAFLSYLVEHPGLLVTKEELLSKLWATCTVCDDALAHSIVEIRKALGDDARAPRFIETVHRRGYRFIGRICGHRRPNAEQKRDWKRNNRKSGFTNAQWVGREFELTQLQACLDEALTGRRQVVFVTGEQGIGKTTLVNGFLATLDQGCRFPSPESNPKSARSGRRSGIWIGRGQCIDFHGSSEAYMPVLQALTQLYQESGRGRRFAAALRRHAPLWSMQMPTLTSAAGLKTLQRTTLGVRRERMLREIAEALEALSAEVPLILSLEDLHWSDPSTIDMISYLARREAPARLMLIGTYRSTEVMAGDNPLKAVKQDLQTHLLCREQRLELLDETAVGKYLTSRFFVHAFPAELGQWIHRRTEGNPLFMVNLVDHLFARGILVCQDGHLTLSVELEKMNGEVPATIQQMVEQQIVQHSEQEQRILEAGSVEGMEFSAAGVALALNQEESLIEEACERLARNNHLLQPGGIRQLTNGKLTSCYRFQHTLYQNVCYQRQLETRRLQVHQRIGEYTELAYDNHSGEGAAKLAMHFEQAREYARSMKYYQQAADNANQRYAGHEAADLARRGLRLLHTIPSALERSHQELGLLIALGTALMWTEGFGGTEVKQVFTRARNLCRHCGESIQLLSALFGLWMSCNIRAEYETAWQLAKQLLQLGKTQQNPLLLSEIHFIAGAALQIRGEYAAALKHLEQGMACRSLQKEDTYRLLDGKNPVIGCLSFAALVKWRLGYPDQAIKKADEAMALAQETRRPEDYVFAFVAAARLYRMLRNSKKALDLIEAAMTVAHQRGWTQLVVDGASVYGWALAAEGHVGEGIDKMRQALITQQEIGSLHMRAELLVTLAEVLRDAGQIGEALTVVDQALDAMCKTGMRHIEANILLLKGDLLFIGSETNSRSQRVQSGDAQFKKAEECFRHAIEVARLQRARAMELRGSIYLARLLQKQNQPAEARQQLLLSYNWFKEGHGTRDLQDAHTLLQQLS